MGLTTQIRWQEGVVYTNGNRTYRSRFGTSPTPSGDFILADGTGSGSANLVFEDDFTVAAGVTLEIDLKGGTGEKDVDNNTLDFDTVKGVEVILTTAPAAGVSLRLGPQGVTDANQLWFQAVTANFYDVVRDRLAQFDRATGWAVGAGTNILALHNPGASSVSGWVRVIGVT